jgi:hypothetical protein
MRKHTAACILAIANDILILMNALFILNDGAISNDENPVYKVLGLYNGQVAFLSSVLSKKENTLNTAGTPAASAVT